MGVREGTRAHLVNAPTSALKAMRLPRLRQSATLSDTQDYIHLFVLSQVELARSFPMLKAHLAEAGMLWVSWPKAKQLGTDLTLRDVIRIGYSHGLVESTTLSVDPTWSAIKFTHPKPGKTYRNSYGRLPPPA